MNPSDRKIIIAIDGYSSTGKSTMARALASRIGYRYVDSGAMYRAVTLYALRKELISADGTVDVEALSAALPSLEIDFAVMPDGTQHTILCHEDVEAEIRGLKVSGAVSYIAAVPQVRHALVAFQQALGKSKGIVMDGRDIGTTVFPDAELKIFVEASPETRARRRYDELLAKGQDVDYASVLANVVERDRIDTTRAESPLRKAEDAVVLDNSLMSISQQNEWLMEQVESALSHSENRLK